MISKKRDVDDDNCGSDCDDEFQIVKTQCGPCRDPLTITAASNTWCHILKYKDVDFEKLCDLGKQIPILYPWSPTYNTKRLIYNKLINQFPSGIVQVQNKKDIQETFSFAQEHKIPISVRSGGHSTEGFSLTQGLVIDMSKFNKIKVLPENKIAIIGAGCILGPTILELQKHGMIIPTGTCANVGISGLCLGGGVGFLDRKLGLTCDNLLEIECILADGKIVIANEKQNQDLFYACRGAGGGNFCLVTKFVFRTYLLKKVWLFKFSYPFEKAKQCIQVFQNWAPFASHSLTVELTLRGKKSNPTFNGQFEGSKEELEKELKNISSLGEPILHEVKRVTVSDAAREHTDNNVRPPFSKVKSSFVFTRITDKGIDSMIKAIRKSNDPNDVINLAALGGKISEVSKKATSYPHRDAIYWIEYVTYWNQQIEEERKFEWVTFAYKSVFPYVSDFSYINFPDLQIKDWKWAFWGKKYEQLVQIKKKYDPTDFFHLPQGIRLE